jgi:UDP-N-acetylglucosamine 2-epimerase (non-hydrolysing)
VEAGIRSGDWTMPEEINRLVTDSITNYFFTTSTFANQNLITSGVSEKNIFFVGNTMIDTLLKNEARFMKPSIFEDQKLVKGEYFILTIHRPANVDDFSKLKILLDEITLHSRGCKIIFPVHPRTKKSIEQANLSYPNIIMLEPLGYLSFNYLVKNSKAVITDSGGITEETTVMGIPCMTLRDSTERPETCSIGTNELLGTNPNAIKPAMDKLFDGAWKKGSIPALWDGKAAERIVANIITLF